MGRSIFDTEFCGATKKHFLRLISREGKPFIDDINTNNFAQFGSAFMRTTTLPSENVSLVKSMDHSVCAMNTTHQYS